MVWLRRENVISTRGVQYKRKTCIVYVVEAECVVVRVGVEGREVSDIVFDELHGVPGRRSVGGEGQRQWAGGDGRDVLRRRGGGHGGRRDGEEREGGAEGARVRARDVEGREERGI